MGALRAWVSDYQQNRILHNLRTYVGADPAGEAGSWTCSFDTVQAALHWRYTREGWVWYKVSHLHGARTGRSAQNAKHALNVMFNGGANPNEDKEGQGTHMTKTDKQEARQGQEQGRQRVGRKV